MYFAMIAIALTMAPYDFQFEELQSFTWQYNSFDLFTNLFLLSPIGFFLTLLKREVSLKYFIGLLFLGLFFSLFIEGAQLFILQRSSQYWDVICNIISLLLGAVAASLILKIIVHRKARYGHHPLFLLSPLLLIGLYLLMRTVNTVGGLDGFTLSLIFISTGIMAITASHVSKAKEESLPYYVFLGCIAYLCIFTFPLFLKNPPIFLVLLLAFPILVSLSTLFLSKQSAFFVSNFRKLISVTLLVPFIYYWATTLKEPNSVLIDFSILPWEELKPLSQGRAMGVVLVEQILMFGILMELMKYALLIYGQGKIFSFILLVVPCCIIVHWYLIIFTHPVPINTSFVYFLYAAILIIVWKNKLAAVRSGE
jgi:VanZ family protein